MVHFVLTENQLQVIALLASRLKKDLSVRETARLLTWPASTTSRVIRQLEDRGILLATPRGGLKLVKLNSNHPSYQESVKLAVRHYGIIPRVKSILDTLPSINQATVYGSAATGKLDDRSDIDLLLVGKVDRDELNKKLNKLEKTLGREVNYTLFNEDEFEREETRSPFLKSILSGPTITLIENDDKTAV